MSIKRIKLLSSVAGVILALIVPGALCSVPCATIKASVTPKTIPRGTAATASVSIKNCSRTAETLLVRYSAEGPCDFQVEGSRELQLARGQTRTMTMPYTVPPIACPGTYTLSLSAYSRKTRVASSSISVIVK